MRTRTKIMQLLSGEPTNVVKAEYFEDLRDNISSEELDKRYENMLILLAQVVPGNNSYMKTLGERHDKRKQEQAA